MVYGIVEGDENIVFIKPGLGSDYLGYENKYLTMAHQLHNRFGYSVIASSNPYDNQSHIDDDKRIVEQFISENGFSTPRLFFFGHSNGGIKGLELTNSGLRFAKMVLVNMPLMINFHKTKRYIKEIPETRILAVYGEHDPSFPYVPFIKGKFENLEVMEIEKADHTFDGMTKEFIELADYLG